VSSLTEGDPRAVVSVINRMGSVMIPGPNATFQEGDIAHIVLHRDAIQNLRARLAAPAVAEHH
jgi:Trk K+ transport system NAD-binding subunit